MSKLAAEGDMRTIALFSFSALSLAVATAWVRDSASVKRVSGYFSARAWPDSPMRTICLMFLIFKIS